MGCLGDITMALKADFFFFLREIFELGLFCF